jgi:hemin uptake protein HemP
MIALRHQSTQATHVAQPLPSHDARALTAGGTQAQIELDGQVYTLRITRAGKLILTK